MFLTLSAVDLTLDTSLDEAIALAAAAGFDAVDLQPEKLLTSTSYTEPARIIEALERAGLRPGGWWLPTEFREDARTFNDDLEALGGISRLAGAVGARWCNTWIWPCSDELDHATNYELHVDRLRPIARILAEHDVVLGLEYVGARTVRAGHTYEFVSTLAGVLELAADVGEPNVGLLLDCWQWYVAHETADDLSALRAGDVTYVHLNDAPSGVDIDDQIDDQRMLPGSTGVIDVKSFLGALVRLDFQGPVAVEPFNAEVNAMQPRARVDAAMTSVVCTFRTAGIEHGFNRASRSP